MENINENFNKCIDAMVDNLPVLRARLGLSQHDLGKRIGVSRQQIANYENRKRALTQTAYLALVTVFSKNEQSRQLMEQLGMCPDEEADTGRMSDDALLEVAGGSSAGARVMFELSYAGALKAEQIREMVMDELRQRGVPESVVVNTPDMGIHMCNDGHGGRLTVMWTEGEKSPSYVGIY